VADTLLSPDWLAEVGAFEPLHCRIGIREDSQPRAAEFELTHLNEVSRATPHS